MISPNHYVAILTFGSTYKLCDRANENIEECNNNRTLYFKNNSAVVPIVQVSTLQVQAFKFKNDTTGEFDDGKHDSTDGRVTLPMDIMIFC